MITKEMLRGLNACEDQIAIFAQAWPNGAEVNLENIQRARRLKLDMAWLMLHGLKTPAARAIYAEARARAWAAYDEIITNCGEAIVEARAAYDEAVASGFLVAWEMQKKERAMPKQIDHNQPEIVAALRAAGATVQHLHEVGKGCPDLLVGFRGVNYLLEIKNPNTKGKLTPAEAGWHLMWCGSSMIVNSIDEALAAIGALA